MTRSGNPPHAPRRRLSSAAPCLCVAFVAALLSSCGEKSGEQAESSPEHLRPSAKTHASKTPAGLALRDALTGDLKNDEVAAKIREIGEGLDDSDLQDVFDFVRLGCPDDVSISAWHLSVNEVFESLRRNEVPGFATRLYQLAIDGSAPNVVRDYAIQHYLLTEEAELRNATAAGIDTAAQVRDLASDARGLLDSLDPEQTAYGTTLMAMATVFEGLTTESQSPLLEDLRDPVLALASGEVPASSPNRIAAIQAASRMGMTEVAPVIAAIAYDETAPVSERLSAIAALRAFPEQIDGERLQASVRRSQRLRFAVNETLKNVGEDAR